MLKEKVCRLSRDKYTSGHSFVSLLQGKQCNDCEALLQLLCCVIKLTVQLFSRLCTGQIICKGIAECQQEKKFQIKLVI